MWYLVVPPIVVVLCLSFLLWYLSRKGSDPTIAQKVLESERMEAPISFPRTKEFFLKILEKFGQRFKVVSLRAHNSLHKFTQTVKANRIKVHTAVIATPTLEERRFVSDVPQSERAVAPAEILVTPIVRRERNVARRPMMRAAEKGEPVPPRPMVSETAAHPEQGKRVTRPDTSREEHMIARIARDPKDFTAYEELGDYYLGVGNIKDAKECYRQVLKLSPVHRMVKIKIRRLEKLLG